jgi:hypothetical protein
MRPDEDHDGLVTREYLFNCLDLVDPIHGTCGSSRAALSQKAGAGAQATCGGPGATLSREAGAGVVGTHGGPRAALSGSHGDTRRPRRYPESRGGHQSREDMWWPWSRPAFCLDLEHVHEGTWSSGY